MAAITADPDVAAFMFGFAVAFAALLVALVPIAGLVVVRALLS